MRQNGKVVLISGGASGIGFAVADKCMREGARVAVIDKQPIDLPGPQLLGFRGDVADEAFVKLTVARVHEIWGKVDGLVNNAGIMENQAIDEVTDDHWERHLNVNVKGAMLMIKHVFPLMKAAGQGAIVNCSSIMAYTSAPRTVAYTVSKTAILGLTRAVAMDGAPHRIRANTVCPGTVDTPLYRRYLETLEDPAAAHARFNDMYPLGRIGTPEDVANVCGFLLSDEAKWITGQSFIVDGGYSIKGTNE